MASSGVKNAVLRGGSEGRRFDLSRAVYFTPVQVALNAEIPKHPGLVEYLRKQAHQDFEIRLAEIARYCGIALDGEYDGHDINNICALCLNELQKRSTLILLP